MSQNCKTMIKDSKNRAKCKYSRVKTLVKNCMEVSTLCNIKMNLLVFGQRGM